MIGRNPFSSGWVLLEERVLDMTTTYRQATAGSTEAGGILMGFRKEVHLHVDALTRPFPTDHRTRTSFRRDRVGHAQAAWSRWSSSGRTSDYLGEWHTHPENYPIPSGKDLREWRRLLKAQAGPLVFLIVGIRDWWVGVGFGDTIERVEWTEAD